MSTVRTADENPNGMPRWLLPVGLLLLIAIILAIAFFASHRNLFSASATNTPTLTPTPRTQTQVVTNTPTPGSSSGSAPTATAGTGPTNTPQPRPSPTPTPPGGVKVGTIVHPRSQLLTIQQGANRKQSQYTLNLDPYRVVRASLPSYGFSTVNIVSPPPPPQPTPTPFSGPNGYPTVDITVQYAGHHFVVQLQQPVQQGPAGIWVVTSIKQA